MYVRPIKTVQATSIPDTYDVSRFVGDEFREAFNLMFKVFYYQMRENIKHGIKGFLVYGEPGTGKTSLAYAVVRELGKRFRNVYLMVVDGADIARPLYGESESRVVEIFTEASNKPGYTIILFDDVESVFMRRDAPMVESWHIAQDNVFFHMLDELDTSRVGLVATTNRFDLVDKAIVDRLYPIELKPLSLEAALAIAERRCRELGVRFEPVREEVTRVKPTSARAIERIVMRHYIEMLERLEIA